MVLYPAIFEVDFAVLLVELLVFLVDEGFEEGEFGELVEVDFVGVGVEVFADFEDHFLEEVGFGGLEVLSDFGLI